MIEGEINHTQYLPEQLYFANFQKSQTEKLQLQKKIY
jgi:hypothetical protein